MPFIRTVRATKAQRHNDNRNDEVEVIGGRLIRGDLLLSESFCTVSIVRVKPRRSKLTFPKEDIVIVSR